MSQKGEIIKKDNTRLEAFNKPTTTTIYQVGQIVKITSKHRKRNHPYTASIYQIYPDKIIIDGGLYKLSIPTDGIDYKIEVL